MKKMIGLLLAAVLFAAMLSGCGRQQKNDVFTARNEILTYRRIDPKKTQIVVSRTGNINIQSFCTEFEAQNPDIQVTCLDITGGIEGCYPLTDWVMHGYTPDIIITASPYFTDAQVEEYLENLSADPIIQNYNAASLQRSAVGDEIYWLPGPSNLSAMIYNKTLFAQYGWETPNTFDEFVALCDRITEDTNGEIEPWNPNAKYNVELTVAMEAFTYEELFGGVENRAWYEDFVEGKATFAGHMEPYMEALQTLIDHNILREEHFSYSATTRGNEFAEGKIAMINMNIYQVESERYDFGYMPYPTTNGELGYLCGNYSSYVGVPKKERAEAEDAAVRAFLEFFSSSEGQRVFIGDSLKSSNVKNTPYSPTGELAALQPAIDAGHVFTLLDFKASQGRARAFLHQAAIDMTAGTATGAEFIASVDASKAGLGERHEPTTPEVIATAAEALTMLETSFYMADAYRETAGADIGLIAHNVAYRGNLMRIFAGDVTPAIVATLKPRSFANNSTLIKVSMTGRQLLDALNAPVGNEAVADCIYAYSGLKCEIAPWNALGSKYLSVKLADGSALQMDKLYTVAVWAGTVADEYITETLETFEGSWEDVMTARLKADGTVAPANDERIKLVWD